MYLHVQSCQTKRLKQVLLKIILNNASSNWWRHSHLKAKHFINKIGPWSKCSIAQRNIKVPFLLKLWNVENFLWKLSSSKLWPFYILYSNLQWTIKNGKFPNYNNFTNCSLRLDPSFSNGILWPRRPKEKTNVLNLFFIFLNIF